MKKEAVLIKSHAESLEQRDETQKPQPELVEVDDAHDPFYDEQYDGEQDEESDDYEDDGLHNWSTGTDYDEHIDELQEEKDEQEKEKRPQAKAKQSKPIQSRKRKEKPQLSLFDMFDGKTGEKTPEEKVKEWGIKYGDGTVTTSKELKL